MHDRAILARAGGEPRPLPICLRLPPIHRPTLRSDALLYFGFHLGMSAPRLSVIGADNAFIEFHVHRGTRLLLLGFAIPRLELSRQNDGKRGAGACH